MRLIVLKILKATCFPLAFAASSALALAGSTSVQPSNLGFYQSRLVRNLPSALWPVFYQALAKDAGMAYNVNEMGCAKLPSERLNACFDRSGAHFSGSDSPLALHLVSYGRSNRLKPVGTVRPTIKANHVSYAHDNLTEWWRVLPVGFEQGFTVAKRPAGHGELTLALTANGNAAQEKGALGWGKLRYGELVVTDAKGKVIPATLKSKGDHILITVNDAHAVYPLTVDPLVWIEQEVTASDGQADDSYGFAVLVSGDTAFVSAPAPVSRPGAVYAFSRSNGVWSETQKLMPTPAETPPPGWSDFFGYSLALSGNTLLVGAPETFDSQYGPLFGAAYMFTKSGDTWTQQQELTPSVGPSDCSSLCFFGDAVALAGDAAVIGAYGYEGTEGAAYVFANSGGTWSQTQQLTASDGTTGDDHEFGYSVAFDGTNLLVGAPGPDYISNDIYPQGAAYAFTNSDGSWTQVQKLTANDGADGDQFGFSLSLTGPTLLVGAKAADIGSNTHQGAAYVFDGSSGTWTQTQKLTASDGLAYDQFGESVAIQNSTALVGEWSFDDNPNNPPAPPKKGETYLFAESNGSWNQDKIFIASDGTLGDSFGWDVALDGTNLLIGADAATINGNQYQGAAYFYDKSDLGLSLSAPQTVGQGQTYVSQTIATNNATAASPAVSATITVPAAASFISASATQGSCSEASGVVTC
ncbi:MAG: FG-GAP repeat protein, partial [Terriglobia bacterium]